MQTGLSHPTWSLFGRMGQGPRLSSWHSAIALYLKMSLGSLFGDWKMVCIFLLYCNMHKKSELLLSLLAFPELPLPLLITGIWNEVFIPPGEMVKYIASIQNKKLCLTKVLKGSAMVCLDCTESLWDVSCACIYSTKLCYFWLPVKCQWHFISTLLIQATSMDFQRLFNHSSILNLTH